MVSAALFPLNTPFKPSPALITLFSVNFFLFLVLIGGFTALPVLIASGLEPMVTLLCAGIFVVLLVIFVIWVRLYYASMWYELRVDEMSWKRGVWFHTTGIVPYNRITNLDIRQGPVMRALGISSLSIQTAGYSGQAVPEIRIEGIEHAEELRELIRAMVRGCSQAHDGTGTGATAPKATDRMILEELVKIRTLLEKT
jgi:membrane protein YdbS with pleckstrin-like domain